MITIKIRLYGAFRNYSQASEIECTLQGPAALSDVKAAVRDRLAAGGAATIERLDALLLESALANEETVLADDALIESNAKLAILPPVCGG